MKTRARIKLEGVVQGVGFRPFVHRLSVRHELRGFIANTSSGVELEVEGAKAGILRFYRDLTGKPPPLVRVTASQIRFLSPRGYRGFRIRESRVTAGASALVSPDIGTCRACRKELADPSDRRFRYPFINCTDCGPRFSIIERLPYDRPFTTMKVFSQCPQCRREFAAIDDRRYHAQPNACADCGPQVRLLKGGEKIRGGDEAVRLAVRLLREGKIIAVKGIGGFHIACDALAAEAVRKLRCRKKRLSKPFAVMAPDAAAVRSFCLLSRLEERLLFGPERPVVLLRKRRLPALELLSPDNNYLGVMAPYSPLHYLLFAPSADGGKNPRLLVMTSANAADEPVAITNERAQAELEGICDYFLVHDREIANRCDDSIVQVMDNQAVVLRRGRGYSPFPFLLDKDGRPSLSCGAELKSTFCLRRGKSAFLSQYIGDLKTERTFSFYTEAVQMLSTLFRVKPRVIACDLHPDYLSTKYAQDRKEREPALALVAVQHHQAHVASVIAEHRIRGKVIGVCFDGIGYGPDGTIWGGEFFAGDLKGMERLAALELMAMPGGDKATQEPCRMGISCLHAAFGEETQGLSIPFLRRHRRKVATLIAVCKSSPVATSSCGRLFDAVSAILGICDIITYEAQAAIRLQRYAEASRTAAAYRFFIEKGEPWRVRTAPMIRELVADIGKGVGAADCARKFHNGLARASADVCVRIRRERRINTVCISGGVFQNKLLLETLLALLRKRGFRVFYNQLVPTNDGAVSLGQAVIAGERCA